MGATGHMNHPLMAVLLETSTDELGFEQNGALRVVCDEVKLQRLISVIHGGDRSYESSSHGCFA
jgi:hypothetical protein